MEEFFRTFNALYNHQSLNVITRSSPQLTGFAGAYAFAFRLARTWMQLPVGIRIAIPRLAPVNEILLAR